jgi:hypothetical protein
MDVPRAASHDEGDPDHEQRRARGAHGQRPGDRARRARGDSLVEGAEKRARDGRTGGAQRDDDRRAAALGDPFRGRRVLGGQHVGPVGDRQRHPHRRHGGEQPSERGARPSGEQVDDDPDRAHDDRPAREGEVDRRSEDGQGAGGDRTDPARLALAAREMDAQHDSKRAK